MCEVEKLLHRGSVGGPPAIFEFVIHQPCDPALIYSRNCDPLAL